jgi:N-acetylneuraminic acid mutarotase
LAGAARSVCLMAALLTLPGCGKTDEPRPTAPVSPPAAGGGNLWTSLAPMLEARQEVCVGVAAGRLYVAGGYRADGSTASTVESYDPATDRWTMAAPLPQGVNHCMAAVVDNRLFVMGGDLGNGTSTSAHYEYSPQSNSWANRANMPTARNAAAALVLGGRIYVVGGAPAATGRTVEAYDPATDGWSQVNPMPTPRNHLAGGAVGNRIFAMGGRPPNTLAANEALEPATGTWTARAPLPTGRSGHAAVVVAGCIYVFGGEGNAAVSTGVFRENEVYDPGTNTWQTLAPMPVPRHGIGAAVIGNRIHVPGGATVQGFGAVGTHQAYTVPDGKSCS